MVAYWYIQKSKLPLPEKTSHLQPANIKITTAGLEKIFAELLDATDFEVQDTAKTMYRDCTMQGTYKGIHKFDKSYIQQESRYQDEIAKEKCNEHSLIAAYFETYWIGENVYYRQYKDKKLTKLVGNEVVAMGAKPKEYLKQIFEQIKIVKINKIESFADYIQTSATVKVREFNGEFIVDIDKASTKIMKVAYMLSSPNASATGQLNLTYPAAEITLPNL